MNMPLALSSSTKRIATRRHTARTARTARTLLLLSMVVYSGFAAHAYWHNPAQERASAIGVSQLAHWRNADHDWLVVNDRTAHALVVYDASSGQPLKRLPTKGDLADVEAIASEGDQLLVSTGDDAPLHVLSLPSLRPQALAAR